MPDQSKLVTVPVGPLRIVALNSCTELGQRVDHYISRWRKERENLSAQKVEFTGYEKESYLAKILAGSTFCLFTVLLYLGVFLSYFGLKWGFGGMDAMEQVIYPFTQMDLTAGQTTVILIVLTILGSVLLSSMTMFISCVLRNGMGTMAIMVGGYLGMFAVVNSIPMEAKTLSKTLSLFPAIQISPRLVYEFRLFKIAGHYFRSYQVAGASYVIISAALLVIGYFLYKRYEIKSN